jgi:ABC-type Fe3+/spermidine/putrescine transport system ATPase subunit
MVQARESTSAPCAVSVRGLFKEFSGNNVAAVDDVSFDVEDGELLVLLGPSGCGKTTTLRMIAGLEEPDDGEIHLGHTVVSSSKRNLFVPTEKRNIGMVFQSYAIWPHMSVFDNVAYPLRVRHAPKAQIRERVEKTLDLLGLGGLESRPATHLSGGQQQRVALARAIVFEPRVLLLDEPLSNLDARLRVHMRTELRHLQQATGIASIFVTHDQAESMALADRIVVMNRGKIEQIGTPVEIYERPRSRFVNEFVGSINMLQGVVSTVDGMRVTLYCGPHEVHGHVANGVRLAPGDRVTASVRPEKVSLLSSPDERYLNRWSARVLGAVYYGDHREYEIEISDQPFRVSTPATLSVDKGSTVVVTCDPDEVVIIPDDRD